MKGITISAVLIAAFFFETAFGGSVALWGIRPPIVAAALFFSFWNMRLVPRLMLAGIVGMLMDGVSIHTFGVHTATFIVLAFFTGVLQHFFSNVGYLATRGIGTSINIFLFLNFTLLLDFLVGLARSLPQSFTFIFWWHIFLSSFAWAALLPALIVSVDRLFSALKIRIHGTI